MHRYTLIEVGSGMPTKTYANQAQAMEAMKAAGPGSELILIDSLIGMSMGGTAVAVEPTPNSIRFILGEDDASKKKKLPRKLNNFDAHRKRAKKFGR